MKTIQVGILGLGFMGKCHYDTYANVKGSRVAAICDIDQKKLSGDWSGIGGNIGSKGTKVDLAGLRLYKDAADLFADPQIDVVDITLPTFLHEQYALAALKAGKHVICEKPLARTSAAARRLDRAARTAGRQLFTAHCIRFWPAYAWLKAATEEKRFGRVISAVFRRHSPLPTWSWRNWLQDPQKSGLCALDLHIHDADFILYCFGSPVAVRSTAGGLQPGRADHIHTAYEYPGGALVTAEGAWEYAPAYPFRMNFTAVFERATVELRDDGTLHTYPVKGKPVVVKLPAASGYELELREFIRCLRTGEASKVITPADACRSVRLIELEERAARSGKRVPIPRLSSPSSTR